MNVHRIVTHLFALFRLEISLSTFCTFSTFLCLTVRFPCLFLFFFIQNRSSCFINSVKVSKNLKIKSRSMYNLFSVFSAFNGVVVVMSQISSQCPQAKKQNARADVETQWVMSARACMLRPIRADWVFGRGTLKKQSVK